MSRSARRRYSPRRAPPARPVYDRLSRMECMLYTTSSEYYITILYTVGIYLRMHLHTRVRDGRFVDFPARPTRVLDCEPGSIPNA